MKSIVTLICLALMNIFALSVEALAEPLFEGSIVFMKDDLQIYLINGVTGHETQVTQSGRNLWPSWAPDGASILYSHNGILSILNVASQNSHAVKYTQDARFQGRLLTPSFDSTGLYIYADTGFITIKPWTVVLDIHNSLAIAGGDDAHSLPKKLIHALSMSKVSESPNGKHLAGHVPFPDGSVRIITIESGGGPQFMYSDIGSSIAWSHDSARIAFVDPRVGQEILIVYDLRTQQLTELPINKANLEYCCGHISWSPDGRYILFSGGDELPGSESGARIDSWVYMFDLETGIEHKLFPGSSPDWRPLVK